MKSTFENACANVGILPTKRQLRKWLRGFGLAFKFKDQDIKGDTKLALKLSNKI